MAEDQPPVSETQGAASGGGSPPQAGAPDPLSDLNSGSADDMSSIDQAAIDDLLRQASFEDVAQATAQDAATIAVARQAGSATAVAAAPALGAGDVPSAENVQLPSFQQVMQDAQVSSIDLLRDVELNVKIELGRARMLVEDVLKLGEGSVVELDKLAGDPVDVFVNERLVARGEVLVLNDSFCVRINEILSGAKDDEL